MHVVVPFDGTDPLSRLDPVLTHAERRDFARACLEDVCGTIVATDHQPHILTTSELAVSWPTRVDDRPLTPAVNAILAERSAPVAVIMADLPLVEPGVIERFLDTPGDVVLAPGIGGGTNALISRHPEFRVDYHGASIRDHREQITRIDGEYEQVDSFRLATDIDEPADLAEVLLHGRGRAHEWLVKRGFMIVTTGGRVTVERDVREQ